jgi:hypothetical protein
MALDKQGNQSCRYDSWHLLQPSMIKLAVKEACIHSVKEEILTLELKLNLRIVQKVGCKINIKLHAT